MTQANIRTETVVRSGMTLSKMVWLLFKRRPSGYVEKVLDINPFLSNSTILEVGTVVKFPLDALADTETASKVVKPWD